MGTTEHAPEAASPAALDARPLGVRPRLLVASLVLVALLVAAILPISGTQLEGRPSFVPALLALVGCLDLLSAVLLVRQFRDTGDRPSLALAWAYLSSLVVLAGYGAAFPGVVNSGSGPLGDNPSTAPWLWTAWHTGFPVLLAFAVAPRSVRRSGPVPAEQRARWVRGSIPACIGISGLVVAFVVVFGRQLPVLIKGTDTSLMTHTVGPVVLPVLAVAVVVAIMSALRMAGPPRWVGLAAAAAVGDVVLTLFSYHRYSLGWYAGRTLTIASSAVVLIAMLAEFSRLKGLLALETERLRALLTRTDELERLQLTLLAHLSEGVMMQDPEGRVVASNPAVDALFERAPTDLGSTAEAEPSWSLLDEHGRDLPPDQAPAVITRRTGVAQRDRMVGLAFADGRRRWLRVNTIATQGDRATDRYVISSLVDETDRHAARLADVRDDARRRLRIETVLDAADLNVLVQPIVDLNSGLVVGGEALSRFTDHPNPTPDRWFADAEAVGLGVELELLAVATALAKLTAMPAGTYLSINVSPATACSTALSELLAAVPTAKSLVLELTEHADVDDYPTLHSALGCLRSRGIRVAVDDTGSGFASLRHILNLRPDIIKLDLALVRDIHKDPARRALAQGMLTFACEIGAEIVAEGIETAAELAVLQDIGIPHGQGYLLGRPAALPLLERFAVGSESPLSNSQS
jgi:EAL domain-containing protein (putative c-di-GMP-specific phosphodiesterase class I)/PAS domain-containing protein